MDSLLESHECQTQKRVICMTDKKKIGVFSRSIQVPAIIWIAAIFFLFTAGWGRAPSGASQVIQMDGLTATLAGEFRTAGSEVAIEFRNAQASL